MDFSVGGRIPNHNMEYITKGLVCCGNESYCTMTVFPDKVKVDPRNITFHKTKSLPLKMLVSKLGISEIPGVYF